MFQETWFIGGGFLLGIGVAFLAIDVCRWLRRRCNRPPLTRGQLHLFEEDGDHFLSAKLPVAGLQQILTDHSQGLLG